MGNGTTSYTSLYRTGNSGNPSTRSSVRALMHISCASALLCSIACRSSSCAVERSGSIWLPCSSAQVLCLTQRFAPPDWDDNDRTDIFFTDNASGAGRLADDTSGLLLVTGQSCPRVCGTTARLFLLAFRVVLRTRCQIITELIEVWIGKLSRISAGSLAEPYRQEEGHGARSQLFPRLARSLLHGQRIIPVVRARHELWWLGSHFAQPGMSPVGREDFGRFQGRALVGVH